jgi:hypothetical protein
MVVNGKPMKSEKKFAKTVNINNQAWVDSLHMESEIPGFYTRYLATVKQDIGVLVTYSINKDKYPQYLQDFENMVQTLKVFRKAGGINAAPANSNLFANTTIPQNIAENTVFNPLPAGGNDVPKPKKESDDSMTYIIGAAVLAIGFLIWKKKRAA